MDKGSAKRTDGSLYQKSVTKKGIPERETSPLVFETKKKKKEICVNCQYEIEKH